MVICACIITHLIDVHALQDQDAWGPPCTGGSKSRLVNVEALGGIACQYADHTCQGVFHCSQINPEFLQCRRYEPDYDDQKQLIEAQRTINVAQNASVELKAIT